LHGGAQGEHWQRSLHSTHWGLPAFPGYFRRRQLSHLTSHLSRNGVSHIRPRPRGIRALSE